MATQAQIEANRRSAQKSTGPRTDAGKITAGQNALRHGLCANFSLMEEETDEEVQALLQALRDEHQPIGATEEILVYKMAQHFFSQKRAEALMNEHLMTPYDGEHNTRELSLLMRYHATADRGFNKCLADLRKLQKERPMQEIGFVSQGAIDDLVAAEPTEDEPDEPASDPFTRVEQRRESDRIWAQFFPRRKNRQIQVAV